MNRDYIDVRLLMLHEPTLVKRCQNNVDDTFSTYNLFSIKFQRCNNVLCPLERINQLGFKAASLGAHSGFPTNPLRKNIMSLNFFVFFFTCVQPAAM